MDAVRSSLRKLFSRESEQVVEACPHVDEVNEVRPSADGCEECLAIGDEWVHLRICMICGHVGCCDNSKHKHATGHYLATGHPIIKSFERGEDWMWCFVDDLFIPARRRR